MRGRVEHPGDQRPLDLGAGGVAAGVGDAVAVVAALAGQRELAVAGAVEAGAERDQLADRGRTLAHEHPHRGLVAEPGAGDERVGECCSGVSPAPSAAAMPPCAQRVEPAASTSLVTSRTRSAECRARCSAAVSPAMPEPTTTTSVSTRPAGRGRGQPRVGIRSQRTTADVVDQPGGADPGRDEQPRRAVRPAPAPRSAPRRAR